MFSTQGSPLAPLNKGGNGLKVLLFKGGNGLKVLLFKGGNGLKVPLFKGDLGGSPILIHRRRLLKHPLKTINPRTSTAMNSLLFKMLEGQVIEHKYHLEKMLGTGGFGAVFLANEVVRDRVLRQVAVKIIPPANTPAAQARQLNELQTAMQLDHPHIIRCFAAGEYRFSNISCLYLVMELADHSLETHLQQRTLTTAPLKKLISEVASALEHFHTRKMVHQDVKPGNILWVKTVWKVSDFGTVRDLNAQSYLQTANPAGTIPYMPPEAFDGVISPAWDMWSLGILSLVATTGSLPYPSTDPNALLKQVMQANLQWSSLPPDLDPLVRGCLQPSSISHASPSAPGQAPPSPPLPQRYQPLEQYLKAQQWKEADQETYRLMITTVGKKEGNWFTETELRNFPCEDLRAIDGLWVKYSNGRFGFSVQKKIYVECGAKLDGKYPGDKIWEKFGDLVGWRRNGVWLYYSDLNPSLSSPQVIFPAVLLVVPISSLFSRIETCRVLWGVEDWSLVGVGEGKLFSPPNPRVPLNRQNRRFRHPLIRTTSVPNGLGQTTTPNCGTC